MRKTNGEGRRGREVESAHMRAMNEDEVNGLCSDRVGGRETDRRMQNGEEKRNGWIE